MRWVGDFVTWIATFAVKSLTTPVYSSPSVCQPVFWYGALDSAWIRRWQLVECLYIIMLQLDDLLSAAGACNGTRFHALALRALRLAECTSRLPCLLGLAHKAVPVPTHAEQLEPISAWLQSTSQAATDLTSSNCFTLEFSANGNQYQSTYIYIYIFIYLFIYYVFIYLFVYFIYIYIYIFFFYMCTYMSPHVIRSSFSRPRIIAASLGRMAAASLGETGPPQKEALRVREGFLDGSNPYRVSGSRFLA